MIRWLRENGPWLVIFGLAAVLLGLIAGAVLQFVALK